MNDSMARGADRAEHVVPSEEVDADEDQREMVSEPAKVMRVG